MKRKCSFEFFGIQQFSRFTLNNNGISQKPTINNGGQ